MLFYGRDREVKEFWNLVEQKKPKTIQVIGAAGVGKSTLMQQLYEQCRRENRPALFLDWHQIYHHESTPNERNHPIFFWIQAFGAGRRPESEKESKSFLKDFSKVIRAITKQTGFDQVGRLLNAMAPMASTAEGDAKSLAKGVGVALDPTLGGYVIVAKGVLPFIKRVMSLIGVSRYAKVALYPERELLKSLVTDCQKRPLLFFLDEYSLAQKTTVFTQLEFHATTQEFTKKPGPLRKIPLSKYLSMLQEYFRQRQCELILIEGKRIFTAKPKSPQLRLIAFTQQQIMDGLERVLKVRPAGPRFSNHEVSTLATALMRPTRGNPYLRFFVDSGG